MSTTEPEDPYAEVIAHLTAARKLLSEPARQARGYAESGSSHAQNEGDAARRHVERLRQRLRVIAVEVRELEEGLARAAGWHDRYQRMRRGAGLPPGPGPGE